MCHVCHKRRQLVLRAGLWHPGCDVDEDIPLAREVEQRLREFDVIGVDISSLTCLFADMSFSGGGGFRKSLKVQTDEV